MTAPPSPAEATTGPAPGGDPAARRSSLLVGTVAHRRRRPRANAFRYRVYHALLDVDELPALDATVRGFAHNRPAPLAFHDVDHLGPVDLPVRAKLAAWLQGQGHALPGGPLLVACNLRTFGHVFDPVSWWFCHELDGRLRYVVAEVHNTFGDQHLYLLDDLEQRPDGLVRARRAKTFHVSPFLPVDGLAYRFTFRPPSGTHRPRAPERFLAHLAVADDQGTVLDATQDERRIALTSRNLRRAAARHPLVTLRTVALIHGQALRLWAKRVSFHRRPVPPDDGYGAIARAAAPPAAEPPTIPAHAHVEPTASAWPEEQHA